MNWLNWTVFGLCAALLLAILWEAFETLVLPRRIDYLLRFTGVFYRNTWKGWRLVARLVPAGARDNFLAVFGPLSLLLLIACWGAGLILCFAGISWALHLHVRAPEAVPTFGTYLYLSATTFITLGFGDVSPISSAARLVADIEAGIGFGFLAIVVGYLPVLYGSFSRREVNIATLDARASSPPSAGELLRRYGDYDEGATDLKEFLREWEKWAAELLESHLSFPVLTYYRSQHDRQSWLSALTCILDTCAFVISSMPDGPVWQARMTFAMARHASVDLALLFDTPPTAPDRDRLSDADRAALCAALRDAQFPHSDTPEAAQRLNELRGLYEPFVHALSQVLLLPLPSWLPDEETPDNWQTSAWDRDDHFFQGSPKSTAPVVRPRRPAPKN
jgi:hypothetical protein